MLLLRACLFSSSNLYRVVHFIHIVVDEDVLEVVRSLRIVVGGHTVVVYFWDCSMVCSSSFSMCSLSLPQYGEHVFALCLYSFLFTLKCELQLTDFAREGWSAI